MRLIGFFYKKTHAAVLAIGLIILFVMTLIGVTALQTTLLEEKIIANLHDTNLAMQSADTALREAERLIESLSDTSGFGTSNGLYSEGNAPDAFAASTWTGTASRTATITIPNVVSPRYFIEMVGAYGGGNDVNIYNYGQGPGDSQVTVFRIIARGTGSTGTSDVMLESFYGKQF